jgi:hypothetical protein
MTIKVYKRSELRDIMNRREAAAKKLGEAAARKYLRKKEEAQPTGIIREALATLIFVVIMAVILVTTLAL